MTAGVKRRAAPMPLSCAWCQRVLEVGEAFVLLLSPDVGAIVCRPTLRPCLFALVLEHPEADEVGFAFVDPQAARALDRQLDAPAGATDADDGRLPN